MLRGGSQYLAELSAISQRLESCVVSKLARKFGNSIELMWMITAAKGGSVRTHNRPKGTVSRHTDPITGRSYPGGFVKGQTPFLFQRTRVKPNGGTEVLMIGACLAPVLKLLIIVLTVILLFFLGAHPSVLIRLLGILPFA
jgi:hypothetical protein